MHHNIFLQKKKEESREQQSNQNVAEVDVVNEESSQSLVLQEKACDEISVPKDIQNHVKSSMRKPSFITKPPAAAVGRYDHIKNSIWPKVVLSSHLNQLLARIIAEQK